MARVQFPGGAVMGALTPGGKEAGA